MISWIQNHLIRHGRWIFLTLLAVIIVAFVFTIGNTPGCTSNQSAYTQQHFYGYDLNSPHEMRIVGEKVSLSAMLNTGRPIQNESHFQAQLTSRIAKLHLADAIGMPAPNARTLEHYIKTRAAFRGPEGQFSRDAYTRFVDMIESNPRISQGLLVTVLEEDYQLDQINRVLAGPGYVLPSEALAQTQRNETFLKLTTAAIGYTDFHPEITSDEAALQAYYTANRDRYEIPERIRASYLIFPTHQYREQVLAPDEASLRAHFIANRARFVAAYEADRSDPQVPEVDRPESEPSPVTFEDVRAAVATELITEAAQRLANQAAQDFAYTLYRKEIKLDTAAFHELLASADLELIEIAPYTAKEVAHQALPAKLLESAFLLSESRYFSDAYALEDGFGVLIYTGRIAPKIPEFEAVAAIVRTDYTAEEKRRQFSAAGERLSNELKLKLDAGIPFVDAAEALDLTVTAHAGFKVSEPPRTLSQAALQQAQGMSSGELSPMLTSGDRGIFVYVEEKNVPEIAADDEMLMQSQDFLKRYASYISSNALVSELIARGFEQQNAAAERNEP